MPGRYEHNRDLQLAELLHQVTLEGWGNESAGDVDQDGFHASLLIVEPAEQSEVTDAFDQPIPAGNWVLTQDEQGFVTLNQHPTPDAARQAFTRLQNDRSGPGDDETIARAEPPLGGRGPHKNSPGVRACPCECNLGGWYEGCGHTGCGLRSQ